MDGSGAREATSGTSHGEQLLRSPEVESAAGAVGAEVAQQLEAALHGPMGTALAASSDPLGENDGAAALGMLDLTIPRRFIATGAALTAAYAAVAAGNEVRTAGALVCAQRLLFPGDQMGIVAVAAAARAGLDLLAPAGAEPTTADAAAAMQRRVAADVEQLDRAYHAVSSHVLAAALSAYSWKQATGGAGPGSSAASGHLGPFLNGLARWAFYVEAALQGIRADDWARTGAALIAARQVTTGVF